MDLLPLIQSLKSGVDQLAVHKQNPDNKEVVQELYKDNVLPNLLQLRKINRFEKNNLESKYTRIKELNQKLTSLQQSYDCLAFEASCLGFEVTNTRHKESPSKLKPESNGVETMDVEPTDGDRVFDAEALRKLDHQTRMKCLDEEEEKRKNLQEKLAQLTTETKNLESLYSASSSQLNSVKPYVIQLLDKLAPKLV